MGNIVINNDKFHIRAYCYLIRAQKCQMMKLRMMVTSFVSVNILSAEYWRVHRTKQMVVKYAASSDTVDCTVDFQ